MAEVAADRDAVLAALDRLTAWSEMARSPQLTRFLAYIVHKRLDGDTQSVKAYSIAVDVFGRPPDFDPQSDPIVRVQARRLRALLDQYYRGPGANEELQIHLPIGRYVPDFAIVSTDPASPGPAPRRPVASFIEPEMDLALGASGATTRPRGHITVSWFVLLVIAIGIAALAYSLSTWGPRREQQAAVLMGPTVPTVTVMEFQNLTGDGALTSAISALAIELVTNFTPFVLVEATYGGRGDVTAPPNHENSFVLTGMVRRSAESDSMLEVSAILTDLESNSVVWNWSRPVERSELVRAGGVSALAGDLVVVVGSSRGPLHERVRQMAARNDIAGHENTYLCGMLFTLYRTAPSVGAAQRTQACLDAHPNRDNPSASMLAAQASLIAETIDTGRVTTAVQMERFGRANALLARALALEPTNSFVWEQRARLHELLGDHNLAEAAYGTSLQLNPSNLDALAAHARHLALIGRLDEAIPMAQRAIESVPVDSVPTWYHCGPALATLRDGDFSGALQRAERCAQGDTELGSVLAVLAAQALGDNDAVVRYLPRVLEVPTFRNVGILSQLRRRITNAALLDQIRDGLTRAGVPSLSLVSPY